eukprot:gene19413-19872_t
MVVAAADNVEALLEKTAVYRQRLSPFSRVLASKLGKKREGMELLRAAGIVLLINIVFFWTVLRSTRTYASGFCLAVASDKDRYDAICADCASIHLAVVSLFASERESRRESPIFFYVKWFALLCFLHKMWPLIPSVLLYFAPTTALSFAVCNIPLATAVAEFRKHLIADKKEDGSDAEKVDGKNE